MNRRYGKASVAVSAERKLEVIRRPVITEKTTLLGEHNQVAFLVAIDACKPEIKAAIEELFKVKVKAVNTLIVKGKTELKMTGGATVLYSSDAIQHSIAQYGGQFVTLSWRELN